MVAMLESPDSLNRIYAYELSRNKRAINFRRSGCASEQEPLERDGKLMGVFACRLPHAVPVAGVYDQWCRQERILRGVGVEGAAGGGESPALVEGEQIGKNKGGSAWRRVYGHRNRPGTDDTLGARLRARALHKRGKRQ